MHLLISALNGGEVRVNHFLGELLAEGDNQAFLDLFDREKTRDLSQCAYDRGIGLVLLDGCKRNALSINYSNTHAFGSAYRCTGFSSRHCGVE